MLVDLVPEHGRQTNFELHNNYSTREPSSPPFHYWFVSRSVTLIFKRNEAWKSSYRSSIFLYQITPLPSHVDLAPS